MSGERRQPENAGSASADRSARASATVRFCRSRLRPTTDSESPPPSAPPAVARLAPPSQRGPHSVRQFPLGALFGHTLALAGLCGLTHLAAPLSIEARAPGRALLALRPSGSRRGTSGASSASAMGLCAQSAYSTFVRRVTRIAVVLAPPSPEGSSDANGVVPPRPPSRSTQPGAGQRPRSAPEERWPSAGSSSGASSAAKGPPRGISVRRWMLETCSANERGGCRISRGK